MTPFVFEKWLNNEMIVGDPSLIKAIIVSIQIVLEVHVILQFFTTAAIDKCELGQA